MPLSTEQRLEIKKTLVDLENQLQEDVIQAKEGSRPVSLDQQAVGRVSRVDAIQQQQMHTASLKRLEKRLSMVKAALGRIDSEEFGDCAICEEPIAFKRLKARPESPLCLTCAGKQAG